MSTLYEAFFDDTYVMQDLNTNKAFVTEKCSGSNGMWLRLFIRLDSEEKTDIFYTVHGCHHLIALASLFAKQAQNKTIKEIESIDITAIQTHINMPKIKKDRLFLLEDALKACIKQLQ
jgi:NifU-like protein involved in Fe-S cluster formation|tara:strand:+ start:890 stop:1243 length:354 start_codon:yes stop_codon:yes gene_type:complete